MKITLNEKQYNEIITALEFYNRFHTGQLSMVLEIGDYHDQEEVELFVNQMLDIPKGDYTTKGLSYEISRMMMYYKNKRDGVDNVHSYKPLNPTGEPFISVEF